MKLPQFTIRDLLLSTTLIGMATGMLTLLLRIASIASTRYMVVVVVYFTIGPLFGAGLFTPIKRPILGADLGGIIQVVGTCILFVHVNGLRLGPG